MAGYVSHFELGRADPERARAFYGGLLGWKLSPFGEGYAIDTPGSRGGLHRAGDGEEPGCTVYFAVADIEAAVARVRELGGEASDPTDVEPTFGRFAHCRDDQGAAFGLHEPPRT